MRIKEISYSRVFQMDGYENKKVGVIIEVQNDDPLEALKEAEKFIESQHPEAERKKLQALHDEKLAEYEFIIKNPDRHSVETITEAALFIKENNNLPF
jgi:hypothetical protein